MAHIVLDPAPTASLAVPAGHATHDALSAAANLPDAQMEQDTDFSGAANPTSHGMHVVAPRSAPVALPAVQSEHTVDAFADAKKPASHGAHASSLVAPATLFDVPAGQSRQSDCSTFAKRPARQTEQNEALACATEPAGHASHCVVDDEDALR